jgi:hypothetical protein
MLDGRLRGHGEDNTPTPELNGQNTLFDVGSSMFDVH